MYDQMSLICPEFFPITDRRDRISASGSDDRITLVSEELLSHPSACVRSRTLPLTGRRARGRTTASGSGLASPPRPAGRRRRRLHRYPRHSRTPYIVYGGGAVRQRRVQMNAMHMRDAALQALFCVVFAVSAAPRAELPPVPPVPHARHGDLSMLHKTACLYA